MGEVKSMSLGAKAAILGVVYGLERMMSSSIQKATGLKMFGNITGKSTKRLQQFQYAGRQALISADSVKNSIIGIQDAMSLLALGKGQPEYMGLLMEKIKNFDPSEKDNPYAMFLRIQEGAQKMRPDIAKLMAGSFNVSPDVLSGMLENKFNEKTMRRAPFISDREQTKLRDVGKEWANMADNIEKTFGKITAKHGGKLVGDIGNASKEVMELVKSLIVLSDNLEVFKGIGEIIKGWALLFRSISDTIKFINKTPKTEAGKKAKADDTKNFLKDAAGFWMENFWRFNPAGLAFSLLAKKQDEKIISPNVKRGPSSVPAKDVKVDITNNYKHEGKDAARNGNELGKAVRTAFRQMPTQGVVS